MKRSYHLIVKQMAEKLIQNYLDNMKELGYTESEAFQFLYER